MSCEFLPSNWRFNVCLVVLKSDIQWWKIRVSSPKGNFNRIKWKKNSDKILEFLLPLSYSKIHIRKISVGSSEGRCTQNLGMFGSERVNWFKVKWDSYGIYSLVNCVQQKKNKDLDLSRLAVKFSVYLWLSVATKRHVWFSCRKTNGFSNGSSLETRLGAILRKTQIMTVAKHI